MNGVSWDDFKLQLKDRFCPVDQNRRSRDVLHSMVQTGTVSAYIAAFQRVLMQCTDVSEAEALDKFIRGLKSRVKEVLLPLGPTTLEEAAIKAERIASGQHSSWVSNKGGKSQ